ncbi:MAG: alpha/beta hydrolase [Actinomycetes bacterium]
MVSVRRPSDRTIRLSDGRNLGFARYGAADGYPVIYCHGGLSCRLDAASSSAAANDAGVTVIAPDRPGIGLSDRHKGASLLDWPNDVAELADALGVERFAVMGWSFGTAYAAACGYSLADRISQTVLIASGIPRDWPDMIGQINSMDRRFLSWSGRLPWLDLAAFRAIGLTARMAPGYFVKATVKDLSPQSRNAITRDPDAFARATIEGLRNPAGVLDDYRIWDQPWGFSPAQIPGSVHLWHGDADELCPPAWSERLATAIPNADLTMVPGAGHFVARDHWPEIFASILR